MAGTELLSGELAARLAAAKEKNPHGYTRDYAAMLGVSEAELTPTFYPGRTQELASVEAVLQSMATLKRVKLMARTSFAVFELFTRVDFKRDASAFVLSSGSCFVALNAAGLGRMFFLAPATEKEKAAILIFDGAGAAALKLYIETEDFDAALLSAPASAAPKAEVAASIEAVKKTLIPAEGQVVVTEPGAARKLIEDAGAKNAAVGFELVTPAIGVFMLHKPVKIVDARGWFNILDDDFNLHLKEEAITRLTGEEAAAWKGVRAENAAGEWVKFYGPLGKDKL